MASKQEASVKKTEKNRKENASGKQSLLEEKVNKLWKCKSKDANNHKPIQSPTSEANSVSESKGIQLAGPKLFNDSGIVVDFSSNQFSSSSNLFNSSCVPGSEECDGPLNLCTKYYETPSSTTQDLILHEDVSSKLDKKEVTPKIKLELPYTGESKMESISPPKTVNSASSLSNHDHIASIDCSSSSSADKTKETNSKVSKEGEENKCGENDKKEVAARKRKLPKKNDDFLENSIPRRRTKREASLNASAICNILYEKTSPGPKTPKTPKSKTSSSSLESDAQPKFDFADKKSDRSFVSSNISGNFGENPPLIKSPQSSFSSTKASSCISKKSNKLDKKGKHMELAHHKTVKKKPKVVEEQLETNMKKRKNSVKISNTVKKANFTEVKDNKVKAKSVKDVSAILIVKSSMKTKGTSSKKSAKELHVVNKKCTLKQEMSGSSSKQNKKSKLLKNDPHQTVSIKRKRKVDSKSKSEGENLKQVNTLLDLSPHKSPHNSPVHSSPPICVGCAGCLHDQRCQVCIPRESYIVSPLQHYCNHPPSQCIAIQPHFGSLPMVPYTSPASYPSTFGHSSVCHCSCSRCYGTGVFFPQQSFGSPENHGVAAGNCCDTDRLNIGGSDTSNKKETMSAKEKKSHKEAKQSASVKVTSQSKGKPSNDKLKQKTQNTKNMLKMLSSCIQKKRKGLYKKKDERKLAKPLQSLPSVSSDKKSLSVSKETKTSTSKLEKQISRTKSITEKFNKLTVKDKSKKKVSKPQYYHGWQLEGEAEKRTIQSVLHGSNISVDCYNSIVHLDGDKISVRDCVLVKSGPKPTDIPYVAKVTHFWKDPSSGEIMMSVLWYYQPEHTEAGRKWYHASNELFASKHKDESSVACIDDKAYVLTYSEYCRYKAEECRRKEGAAARRPVVPSSEDSISGKILETSSPETVYMCRQVYDFKLRRILKNPS